MSLLQHDETAGLPSGHNKPGRPEVITFGCRLNTYESEVMRGHGDQLALDDTIIINTCAVTAEAERQARQAIRKARRLRPDARIIVTGCAAQIKPAAWADMPEVDQVIGNVEKMSASSFVGESPALQVNDIIWVKPPDIWSRVWMDGRVPSFKCNKAVTIAAPFALSLLGVAPVAVCPWA